jgi:phosphatidylglycerol:prolipoprotein diacylglycerol transferase
MHPDLLFHLGSIPVDIKAYPLFIGLAALVVIVSTFLVAVRRGFPRLTTLLCLLAMAAAGLIGARLFDMVLNWNQYQQDLGQIFTLQPVGFAIFGSLMLSAVVGVVACRLAGFDPWRLADASAPALGLGIAVARVGCFLNGCCYGVPTSLPWGVVFPPGSPAYVYERINQITFSMFQSASSLQPLHPTQLYELLAGLVGALLAAYVLRREFFDGAAFLVFVIWFTSFRYFNNYLRASNGSLPDYFYPVFYSLILLAAILIWDRRRKKAFADRAAPAARWNVRL